MAVLLILLFTIIFVLLVQLSSTSAENVREEIGLSTMEIIKKLGYPLEVHTVQTEDGYILDVHRIPHGKNRKSLKNTSPVLIYAGIFTDSSAYVSLGSNKSLGFTLADLGYDVWLGNTRRTTHCRKHVKLHPYRNKKQFWDFSFQEIGLYDIPATIDYILEKTKKRNLYYIGFSQGTTSVLALLAEKQTYNKKIRLLITLAPIINLRNIQGPILTLLANETNYFWVKLIIMLQLREIFTFIMIYPLINKYELYDILTLTEEIKRARILFCSNNSTTQDLCVLILWRYVYSTYEQIDRERLPVVFSNIPSGGSYKEVQHFLQLRNGIFQKYDYGTVQNLKLYNSETPPIYNLSQVNVPTAIFYSTKDTLATYHNVEVLMEKLPNIIFKKSISDLNHLDILLGKDAHKFVNADVANLLKY